VLPIPESKRAIKIVDTKYETATYDSLFSRTKLIESKLETEKQVMKRFEDKTKEEIDQDKKMKNKQRIERMMKIRTYQFGGMGVLIFFYMFVYRKFLHPKPVMNSVVYH